MEWMNVALGAGGGILLGVLGYAKHMRKDKKVVFEPQKFGLTVLIGAGAGLGITLFGLEPDQAVMFVAGAVGATQIGQDVLKGLFPVYFGK
jgi:hypothetical protein